MPSLNKSQLLGITTALVTPFDDNDRVDEAALRLLINRQIENGMTAVAVVAGSGEYVNLSPDERELALRISVEEAAGRVPIIAGVLAPNTREAVAWSTKASKLGADALLVLTPYYNSPSPDGLVSHFEAVTRAVDTPVILYNNPGRTNLNLTINEYKALYENDRIVGVKECHRDLSVFTPLVLNCGTRWAILSGEDDLLFPTLMMGADGGILTTSNIVPREWSELYAMVRENKTEAARHLHERLSSLISTVYTKNHPALIKASLDMLGLPGRHVRAPLMAPNATVRGNLGTVLLALSNRGDAPI